MEACAKRRRANDVSALPPQSGELTLQWRLLVPPVSLFDTGYLLATREQIGTCRPDGTGASRSPRSAPALAQGSAEERRWQARLSSTSVQSYGMRQRCCRQRKMLRR